MNRYLWKLGTEEAVYYRELKQMFIDGVVNGCVNYIKQNVSRVFPECNIVPVGSFEDETQVGIPNEFDFIFEIPDVMSLADYNQSDICLQILPVNIPVTGPQQSCDIKNRTYVNLSSSHPWGHFGQDDDPCLLDPRKLQSVFQQCVKETIQDHYKSTNRSFEITLRGPAVCVFMDIQTSDLKKYTENNRGLLKLLASLGTEICIKLDLVLGIPFGVLSKPELHICNKQSSWRIGNARLTTNAQGISKCHLVISGNFFHVSFSQSEAQIVNQHIAVGNVQGEVKKACMNSIKVSEQVELALYISKIIFQNCRVQILDIFYDKN